MRFQFRIDYIVMPFMRQPRRGRKYVRARSKAEAAKKFMARYDNVFCPVDIVSVDDDFDVPVR